MVLNFSGLILSWIWVLIVCFFYDTFKVKFILLSSLFTLFGGATHVTTALVYTEAAIFSSNRTTTFLLLEGIIQVSQLIGPVIGSSLLMLGIAVPFYFVVPLACLSIPLAFFLPGRSANTYTERADSPAQEDLDGHRDASYESEEIEPLLSSTPENTGDSSERNSRPGKKLMPWTMHLNSDDIRQRLQKFWRMLVEYRIVQYTYAASLVIMLGKQALHILLQYTSKRFGVTIAEAGFLFSVKAVVVMVLYALVLPLARRTTNMSESNTNARMAQASIVLLVIGTLMMGMSWDIWVLIPGLVVYCSGFGFPIVIRSLVTSVETANHLSIPLLYSGLAIAETVGSFVGATVLTAAFTTTIDIGGAISGVPFFACSAFYAVIALPTLLIDLRISKLAV